MTPISFFTFLKWVKLHQLSLTFPLNMCDKGTELSLDGEFLQIISLSFYFTKSHQDLKMGQVTF